MPVGVPLTGALIQRLAGTGRTVMPAAAVRDHGLLDRRGQVVPQMPPVGGLHRLRRAVADRLGIRGRPVAADHLDLRVFAQPGGQSCGLAVAARRCGRG